MVDSGAQNLLLLLKYLGVVSARDTEDTVVHDVSAVDALHSTLEREPEWEPTEDLKDNGAQTPDVEDVGALGEVINREVSQVGELSG